MTETETECCAADAAAPATAKVHASLNVSDLSRSVAFYRLLLGCDPAKERADYAKFELVEPPLVLSLIPGRVSAGGNLNHFGLRMPHSESLVAIQHRLETAGIRTQREEGVECCYAKQTKFWVTDPDRALWEIYVFHEDIEERGAGTVPELGDVPGATQQPQQNAASRVVWQHRIGEPVPSRIPHEDFSVHEVSLEGTANLAAPSVDFSKLLGEAFRVLRPGGELRIHGLSADRPLTGPLPSLPGPAAAVGHVPSHAELLGAVSAAGFVGVRCSTLSATVHFAVENIPLREIVVTASKLGHRPAKLTHTAIYLGPLAEALDDFGNVFHCGKPVRLNVHDYQALASSSVASQFLLLPR